MTTFAFIAMLLSTECPATDPTAVGEVAGIVDAASRAPVRRSPAVERSEARDAVDAFYRAFVTSDFDGMDALYDEQVSFKDPIFEYEDRAGTMGMWRNLLGASQGGRFTYRITGVEGDTVTVHWIADYEVFGRPVHNEIDTTMTVRDGKIVHQRDVFSWERWAEQALPLGMLSTTKPVRWIVTRVLRYVASRPPSI